MSLKERLDRIFDVSSYGYVVNKWFLRIAFLIMICLFLIVVRVDGFDVAVHGSQYIVCDDVRGCLNPFGLDCESEPTIDGLMFNNLVDCKPQIMFEGDSFGFKASGLARVFPYLCVGLFAFALLLNHLMYNKNFKVKKNEKN
jgi:hypothetical protein